MRDWGWQDRAEWTAQDTGRGNASERTRRSDVTEDRPVWSEWEGVVEEHFGAVIWEWYIDRCNQIIERKKEKEWDEKVKIVVPLIRDIASKHGCTVTLYAALDRLEGRKPKSRWRVASGDMVALWRAMSVEEILAHVEAHLRAADSPDDGEVQETRVSSVGTIPSNNPFAALKGKF